MFFTYFKPGSIIGKLHALFYTPSAGSSKTVSTFSLRAAVWAKIERHLPLIVRNVEFGGLFQLTVTLSLGSFLLLPTSRPVSTKGPTLSQEGPWPADCHRPAEWQEGSSRKRTRPIKKAVKFKRSSLWDFPEFNHSFFVTL